MVNVQITLIGQQIPTEALQQFLCIAAQHGFALQDCVNLDDDIPDLGAYLRVTLNERYRHWPGCFTRFQGQSLLTVTNMTTQQFFFGRIDKPYRGPCACLRIDSIVLGLMRKRNLCFTDANPKTMFATNLMDADLQIRTCNTLRREGLDWLEQCAYLTQADIKAMRGAGQVSIDDLQARLGMRLPEKW